MINKNGKCVSKFGICLNVLLHYGRYKKLLGEQVKVIKNDGLPQYANLINEVGYVSDFEYRNFEKPIIITFFKNNNTKSYCFSLKEIERIKKNV